MAMFPQRAIMREGLAATLQRRLDPDQRYGLRLTLFGVAFVLVAVPFGIILVQVLSHGPLTTVDYRLAEQFSGIPGKDVSLNDALDGCERILKNEFKDYPESAFYMIGAIGEAEGKAKRVKAAKPEPAAAPKLPVGGKPAPAVARGGAAH